MSRFGPMRRPVVKSPCLYRIKETRPPRPSEVRDDGLEAERSSQPAKEQQRGFLIG